MRIISILRNFVALVKNIVPHSSEIVHVIWNENKLLLAKERIHKRKVLFLQYKNNAYLQLLQFCINGSLCIWKCDSSRRFLWNSKFLQQRTALAHNTKINTSTWYLWRNQCKQKIGTQYKTNNIKLKKKHFFPLIQGISFKWSSTKTVL